MGALRISGDTSGFVELKAPAIAGAAILSLPSANGTILAPAPITTNGSLLIGNTVSGGFDTTTITQGTNVVVTNNKGSITVASSDAFAQTQANSAFDRANTANINANTANTNANFSSSLAILSWG